MEFEFDGKQYKVGDSIEFYTGYRDEKLTGIIRFGIYEDNEGYADFEHYGYFVEYPDSYGGNNRTTFPDAVRGKPGEIPLEPIIIGHVTFDSNKAQEIMKTLVTPIGNAKENNGN